MEYTHQCEDGEVVTIDTATGIATFKGVTYHKPYTLDAADGEAFMKPVPLALFATIDFSRIEKVQTIGDGLGIAPVAWNCVMLMRRNTVASASLVGTKRCSC